MLIKSVRGSTPSYGLDCFFAENSTLIGDVKIGDEVSVWYQAVVRGDVNSIRIGNKVNIQDGVVIHATFETASTHIGNNVSIGHNAIVHGCKINDNVLKNLPKLKIISKYEKKADSQSRSLQKFPSRSKLRNRNGVS